MNSPDQPQPAEASDERMLRHDVEMERMHAHTELEAAKARSPGEWFDIYHHIVETGVRHTLEMSFADTMGSAQREHHRIMKAQEPYSIHVRRKFEAHGLPLTEDIEYEGPRVAHDEAGVPHIVAWPRGVWIEFYWPVEGPRGAKLRFEGQSAITALGFIQFWTGFQQRAQAMAGREKGEKTRLITPGSDEYVAYLTAKARSKAEERAKRLAQNPDQDPDAAP